MKAIAVFFFVIVSQSLMANPVQWLPNQHYTTLDYYDECGHNGAGSIGRFDPATFKASEFRKQLEEKNKGCNRIYSRSITDGIETFLLYTTTPQGPNGADRISQCVQQVGRLL